MKIKGSSESSFLGFQGRLFLAATLLLLCAMLNTALAEEPREVDSAIRDLPKPVATTIYVSDYQGDLVEFFPLSGGTGTPFATIDAPTGLAFDMVGNLYVSSLKPSGMISKVTPNGRVSLFSDDPDLGNPHGLAFDAGSSGAHTFPGFRRNVINVVDTRVFALLNISVVGQSTYSEDNPYGELLNLGYANPKLAIQTIERNRDVILGIKVRLSRPIAGENDLQALKLAKEAVNRSVDVMGQPAAIDQAFALHQLCHAHNLQEFGLVVDPAGLHPSVKKPAIAK
jgi:hypothetical protein